MLSRTWVLALLFACSVASADSPQQFVSIGDLELVSGETLLDAHIGFRTAGTLNEDKSNVLVFPTWFSGTTGNLIKYQQIGPGKLADTDRYFVIAVDSLANGVSSSPSNSTRQPGKQFPRLAIADMVSSQHALLTGHFGLNRVHAIMGISMGGMQTFGWIGQYADFMQKAVAIDGSPRPTSYDLLQWHSHESAIEMMQQAGIENAKIMKFLSTLSLLTLWTPGYFVENITPEALPKFVEDSTQDSGKGDANDYLVQLRAMIGHDVYANDSRDEIPYVKRVHADLLVIGTTDDHMVNAQPGRELSRSLGEQHVAIDSNCGHLGSSCEAARVTTVVHEFLESGSDSNE